MKFINIVEKEFYKIIVENFLELFSVIIYKID